MNRRIPLDGACNFRDIGGLETRHGDTLRPGILFRSDDLSRLTDEDLEKVRRLGLKVICDLRTPNERGSKIDRVPAGSGVRIVDVPVYHRSRDVTHLQFFWLLAVNARSMDFDEFLKDLYRRFAFERPAVIHEIISLVLDEKHLPAVIHCTIGRDRTGLIAALIQLLAGVPRPAVVEDYLVSNESLGPRMEKLARYVRWMSLFQISPARMEPMMEARREYLEHVLDSILEKYGSVEGYLTEHCGFRPEQLSAYKRLLREPG